jgi:DNA-binding transcriptional ArsR family regulator
MMSAAYLEMPDRDSLDLVEILGALGDPVRLEIVRTLAGGGGGERACATFVPRLAGSTRSHHLRVLREAGVTMTRRDGTKRLVSLRRDDLDARFPGLLDAVLGAIPAPRVALPRVPLPG